MFPCYEPLVAFALQLTPMIILKSFNLLILISLSQFYSSKSQHLQAILSCLDPNLRNLYRSSTSANLPSIPLNNPNNIVSCCNLIKIFMNLHSTNIKRAAIFCQVQVVVVAISFLHLFTQIVFEKK
jgi:hypothetical protein